MLTYIFRESYSRSHLRINTDIAFSITFFSGSRSKCLDDPPRISLPGFTGTSITGRELPGVVFDGDTQCEFLYGEGFRRCYQMRVSDTNF